MARPAWKVRHTGRCKTQQLGWGRSISPGKPDETGLHRPVSLGIQPERQHRELHLPGPAQWGHCSPGGGGGGKQRVSLPLSLLEQQPTASDGRAGAVLEHCQVAAAPAYVCTPSNYWAQPPPSRQGQPQQLQSNQWRCLHQASHAHLATGGEGEPSLGKGRAA